MEKRLLNRQQSTPCWRGFPGLKFSPRLDPFDPTGFPESCSASQPFGGLSCLEEWPIIPLMSVTQILEELPSLGESDRQTILHRLVTLDPEVAIEETPELLAAIDAGIESGRIAPAISLQDARRRLGEWLTK